MKVLTVKIKKLISGCLSDKLFLKIQYYRKFNKFLNLKSPQTLNEKLQWLKLYDRTPLHTVCADKLKVRNHIKEVLGEEYLIPLVLSTKNVNDITPDNLPNYPVIIKTNHDSGTYFIIKNKESQNWKEIRAKLSKSLKVNYYKAGREWQYKNIEPFIIVEKLLINNNGTRIEDYKFECFNGNAEMINVDFNKEDVHKRNNYDINWNLLPILWPKEILNGHDIPKPKELESMIKLAEKLASDFCFCRVDFYFFEDKIFFGEITFHPTSGYGQFYPEEKDLYYGNLIKLPKKQ